MKLWSLQSPKAYARLLQDGVLRGDGRHSEREFREPYQWMKQQMKERVPSYKGGTLLWAWHTPKPDLRRMEHYTGSNYGIRLEITMDPSKVLLSDYDAWHHVLNKMYLPLTYTEYVEHASRWDTALDRLKAQGGQYREAMADEFRSEIRSTWTRCFDLPAMQRLLTDPDYGHDGHKQYVQAVFEEIHLKDVTKVTRYTPR